MANVLECSTESIFYVYVKHKLLSQETETLKIRGWTKSPEPSDTIHAYRKVSECLNNPWHFLLHLKLHFSPLKQEKKEVVKIAFVEFLVSIQKNPAPLP